MKIIKHLGCLLCVIVGQALGPRLFADTSGAAVIKLEQVGDVWWFRSAGGKQFLSIGMNHVEPTYWTSPNNREFVAKTYGTDLFLPNGEFNDHSEAAGKWAKRVNSNLKAWGFNTLGMHNPPLDSLRSEVEGYYVVTLKIRVPWGWNMKRSELLKGFAQNPLDVFGDAFAAEAVAEARQEVQPRAKDPRVLGYAYTDGPPWTIDDDLNHGDESLHPWVHALMSLPSTAKGKQAWLRVMKERHASAADAGLACGQTVATWDQLVAITKWDPALAGPRVAADSDAVLEQIMRQWYKVQRDAIRLFDRHHLILGDKLNTNRDTRHFGAMQRTLRVLKDYVDVIFIQYYSPADKQRGTLATIYETTAKPILIGDTACRPLWVDHELDDPVYYGELGQVYAQDIMTLLALPYVVGWHHCGYMHGLRPPYVAALKRGDQAVIDMHHAKKITLREGFISELEQPLNAILQPLTRAIAECEKLHRAAR